MPQLSAAAAARVDGSQFFPSRAKGLPTSAPYSRRLAKAQAQEDRVTKKPADKKTPPDDEKPTLDTEAMTAAIAGFLACHVLTLKFLTQEGVIDPERFVPFLQTAIEEMRPGLADPRSLFVLNQIVNALRAPETNVGLQ
jgi:hypothetical protein